MSFKLEEKENKTITGLFPGIIEEVKNNIINVSGANADMIAPNEDEQKVILANKKYIKAMADILWFGEEVLSILQNCKGDITDASAIIFLVKGFSIYANNRCNELERSRKTITGEQFYYHDNNGQMILKGLNNKDTGETIEDLSYNYNKLYSRRHLRQDTNEAISYNDKATDWILKAMKDKRIDALPSRERDKFFDLVLNARLINNSPNTINSLLKLSPNEEEFKICQSLLMNYNSFVKRAYMECWAFKVNNNL